MMVRPSRTKKRLPGGWTREGWDDESPVLNKLQNWQNSELCVNAMVAGWSFGNVFFFFKIFLHGPCNGRPKGRRKMAMVFKTQVLLCTCYY